MTDTQRVKRVDRLARTWMLLLMALILWQIFGDPWIHKRPPVCEREIRYMTLQQLFDCIKNAQS